MRTIGHAPGRVSELPSALVRPPVKIVRLVFVPSGRPWGSRRPFMHDRISHCECSYWQVHKTIRHWGDPAPGSPEISPHSPASPERMRGGSLSQSSGPGRGTASPGREAGESGVRVVALAGLRVRLAGDGDSGPGLVRSRQEYRLRARPARRSRWRSCSKTKVSQTAPAAGDGRSASTRKPTRG